MIHCPLNESSGEWRPQEIVDYQEKGRSNEKIRVRPGTPHGEHKHVNRAVAQNSFLMLSDKPKGI